MSRKSNNPNVIASSTFDIDLTALPMETITLEEYRRVGGVMVEAANRIPMQPLAHQMPEAWDANNLQTTDFEFEV